MATLVTEQPANHRFGTRDEWLKERLELLEAEKALTRQSDEVARRRRQCPGAGSGDTAVTHGNPSVRQYPVVLVHGQDGTAVEKCGRHVTFFW